MKSRNRCARLHPVAALNAMPLQVYMEGFYKGIMAVGEHKGMKGRGLLA